MSMEQVDDLSRESESGRGNSIHCWSPLPGEMSPTSHNKVQAQQQRSEFQIQQSPNINRSKSPIHDYLKHRSNPQLSKMQSRQNIRKTDLTGSGLQNPSCHSFTLYRRPIAQNHRVRARSDPIYSFGNILSTGRDQVRWPESYRVRTRTSTDLQAEAESRDQVQRRNQSQGSWRF